MTHRTTNIPQLDDFLEGGLKKNTITLFSAVPGVENTPFAYQIMNQSLAEGESVVYVTNSKGVNAVEEDMKCNGLDLSEYRDSGKLVYVDAYSGLVKKEPAEKYHPRDAKNINSITKAVDEALRAVKDDHTLLVYDSLSTLVDQSGPEAIDAIGNWKKMLSEHNATGVFLFTEWPYENNVASKLKQLSDAVIQLSATEKKVITEKYLSVAKANWANKIKDIKLSFKAHAGGLDVRHPGETNHAN